MNPTNFICFSLLFAPLSFKKYGARLTEIMINYEVKSTVDKGSPFKYDLMIHQNMLYNSLNSLLKYCHAPR